ncbi:MAG TPA: LysR family transcriptional regulator [Candidatus Methanofastidiosa archaeon]|nr:LysR family transcriptional regulator [Candidatus Methanofastidiosa archaeon]HPR41142.1 LysR family transcriptional regulator [Candidatus Methanofastidiosa archaeon]
MKVFPKFKLWLENDKGQFLIGEGTFKLLKDIEDTGSLSDAAKKSNISYAHAWKKIRKVEKILNKTLVERTRGGVGGGHSQLADEGKELLDKFMKTREILSASLKDE